jgi:acetate kinase
MSLTPLDGLVMATRCGAIDPGLLLYLLQAKGFSIKDLEDLLYHRSGLLGISGISADMRVLLASLDPNATIAVEQFCARVAEHIAAMATNLAGMNLLVFTAGIGENSPEIRRKICERLQWLGVELDLSANHQGVEVISPSSSRIEVRLIPTDEESIIARHTALFHAG